MDDDWYGRQILSQTTAEDLTNLYTLFPRAQPHFGTLDYVGITDTTAPSAKDSIRWSLPLEISRKYLDQDRR